jgi:hypothetical protein
MRIRIIGAVALAAFISGCATSPENIRASYVAPSLYSSYDCAQTKVDLMRVSDDVAKVTGQQRNKANNDKWATGVGVVLFWPALFFLAVGDKKDQLAHLKGQYDALVINANDKKCDYAHDLRPSS